MRELAPRIIAEQVLYQQGSFRRVRQYLAGWYPQLGTLHIGWSGPETIVEKDQILPAGADCILSLERTRAA